MRYFFILFLITNFYLNAKNQTVDFTIELFLQHNVYKNRNLCQYTYDRSDLLKIFNNNDSCFFYCKKNNLAAKSDSIILCSIIRHSMYGEPQRIIQLEQFYNQRDSAIIEYDSYLKTLEKKLDSDSAFYGSKIEKIADNKLDTEVNNDHEIVLLCNVVKFLSLQFQDRIFIYLLKKKNSYLICTEI